jgi:hypothetical protein
MSYEIIPIDNPDEEDPDVCLRLWREKWGGNSPWDLILSSDVQRGSDYKRFSVDTLNKGDLVEAYEAASWIVASLSLLEQTYGDFVRMAGEGDHSITIRDKFLENIAWFCSCLHTQVISKDWEAIAAVDLELASVRNRPARIGRNRRLVRPVPEIQHNAASMAVLVAQIHRHAFGCIHNAYGRQANVTARCGGS